MNTLARWTGLLLVVLALLAAAPQATHADETSAVAFEPLRAELPGGTAAAEPPGWVALLPDDAPELALAGVPVTVARGARLAVVRLGEDTWLAVDRDQGVLGKLAVPAGTHWVGADDADRILTATTDGKLYGAGDASAAQREDGFRRLAELDGALAWDLAPGVAVACSAERVDWIALDTTTAPTVTRLTVALPDETVLAGCEHVFVRADGTLVVVGGARQPTLADELPGASRPEDDAAAEPTPVLWISTDRGATWRTEPRDPDTRLRRTGQWIWNGDPSAPRVLATDATWIAPNDPWALAEPVSPDELVTFGDEPLGHHGSPRLTLLTPAAPTPAAGLPPEAEPVPLLGAAGVVYGYGGLGTTGQCTGTDCLERHGDSARARYRFGFFSDGSCALPASPPAPEPSAAPDKSKRKVKKGAQLAEPAPALELPAEPCTVAHMSRLPRLGVLDRQLGKLDFVGLPESCATPLEVQSAAGLGLLFCAGDAPSQVRVFARSPEARWADEGLLPRALLEVEPEDPGAESRLTMAPEPLVAADGTVLLEHPGCGSLAQGACPSWIRRPVDPGTPGAWSEVTADGRAVAGYRLLGGGRSLLVQAAEDDAAFEVLLGEPGGAPSAVSGPIPLEGLALYDLRREDDCLVARVGAPGDAATQGWRVLGRSGVLLDAPTCSQAHEEHARMLRQGWLRVRCNQPEATVLVAGQGFEADRLRCPLDVEVEPGTYEISVAALDHDPYQSTVEVPERGEVTIEAELLAIPFIDIRALGGVTVGGGSELTVPVFVTELAFSLGGNQYEVGPLFRLGIASDPEREHGLLGGAFGRAVWHFDAWDVGVGGTVAFGNLLGKEPGGKENTDSVYTLRYGFDVVGGWRLGTLNLRTVLRFYPTSPYTFEAVGGLGLGF